jgi:hypothetical protein
MMQKDEDELLQTWARYHGYLFGIDNLYVYDNGSTSLLAIEQLRNLQSEGLNVDTTRSGRRDFEQKGNILGDKIRELDASGLYDYFIPLDCDEFIVLQLDKEHISCDSGHINEELAKLHDDRVFLVQNYYSNILGFPDLYWCWGVRKTFFKKGTFEYLDLGFHSGRSRKADGAYDTPFAYMHFNHKPYRTIVEHARNKLQDRVDVNDRAALAAFHGTGYHIAKYLLESEEEYLRRFRPNHGVHLPSFAQRLRSIGAPVPFEMVVT